MNPSTTRPAQTRGPWTIHKAPSDRQIQITGKSDRDSFTRDAYIATLPLSAPDHPYRSEEEANARLVAAAPELLEALQAIANDCEAWLDDTSEMSAADLFAAFQSAAEKAIAKAESR